jgi:hypothetical protein
MKNLDPGEKQQQALPVCVYREFHRIAASAPSSALDLDKAIAQLLTIAFFFCMRSCKYSDVQGDRWTKLLCVRNLRFFMANNQDITDKIPYLHLAETVTITLEFQKRDVRNDIISHQRSNDKHGAGDMCPVRAAAFLIQRLSSYANSLFKNFKDTPINLVWSGDDYYTIPSSLILQRIRSVVDHLGFEKLGFTSADVGTHSNLSGGAMGMFLAGTPVYTLMLMGRWSSDAFMHYIRKQVLKLSHGISSKMLTFDEFYTVPDFVHSHANGGLAHRQASLWLHLTT